MREQTEVLVWKNRKTEEKTEHSVFLRYETEAEDIEDLLQIQNRERKEGHKVFQRKRECKRECMYVWM